MKVWIKSKEVNNNLQPDNINIANAMYGFQQLGAETIMYVNFGDIYDWVTADDIVVSYLDESLKAFDKFNVIPDTIDYPKGLNGFYDRHISEMTYEMLTNILDGSYELFVKPVQQKAFTGLVVKNRYDLDRLGIFPREFKFYTSEPVEMLREWRMYIKHGEVLDIRPYDLNRNFEITYNQDQLRDLIKAIKNNSNSLPAAYSVDIAQCGDGKLRIVEVNDGFALASYGLQQLDYAKFLSARWSELLNRHDIYNF